ncbi:MAG: hypothetical protein HY225_01460 [Candidatus Vogelbacteria bacterium]|nr:hypothetical protein [Candidatus Vogelbacteria bacterium]
MGIEKFRQGQFSGEGLGDIDRDVANQNIKLHHVLGDALSPRFGSGHPQPEDEEMFRKVYNLSLRSAIKWAEKNKKGELSDNDKFFVLQTIKDVTDKEKKTIH